jgi:malate dehydrogenase
MKKRIAILGSDAVTDAIATRLARHDYAELVLIGAAPDAPAEELRAAIASDGGAARVLTGRNVADASGASIVVLADAELPLEAAQLAARCPNAVVVVAGEHVLERTAEVLRETAFPRQRVIGLAGEPSAARLRSLLAAELGVWPAAVNVLALGGPGSRLVVSAPSGLPRDRFEAIVEEDRSAGERAAGPALSAAVADAVVDAIACDSRRVIVCAVRCAGEYGIADGVVAAPVVLGADGMQRVVEVALEPQQRAALAAAAVG